MYFKIETSDSDTSGEVVYTSELIIPVTKTF